MAKKPAKPSTPDTSDAAGRKKPAAKAPARVPPKPAGGAPAFDTTIAANAAAALVGRRISLNAPGAPRQESAAFKQMKQSVAKPHVQGLSNVLDTTNQNKKPNLPIGGGKQVAHNQTFSADVTRSGVPRRTPG